MTTYIIPPRPERPSSRLACQSACQGALRIAATSSAAQKCTTLGVLNVANASLGGDTRTLAIKVITTNIKPVSVAAAEPMMTEKFCQVASGDSAASCMMDPPFDANANGRRLIRESREGG